MPAQPQQPPAPSFWELNITKKIILGLLFFAAALACLFLIIPAARTSLLTATDIIIPALLILLALLVLFQLARRKNAFVVILLGLTLLGGLSGWGLRTYSDQVQATKIIVLVPRFDGEEDQNNFRAQIIAEIKLAAKDLPDVEIIASEDTVTRDLGATYARQLGEKAQADIVVWAWYKTSLAPRLNMFIEDTSPAALDAPLPADASQPQPIVAYLRALTMRRSFTATSDTFTTLMAALLNYKSGNYQVFLDRAAQVIATKDVSMLLVPSDVDFYVGVSHTLRKETDLAIEVYSQAIKTNRKGPAAYNNRALAYIEQGKHALAQKDCELGLVIDSQYTVLYNTTGIALLGLKDYEKAVRAFSFVIANDPTDSRAYHNRALAYQALGKTDFAAADLKKETELRNTLSK